MEEPKIYHDKRGRRIDLGSVLKIYHFTGARRKRHFMYKVVVEKNGRLVAMDICELATKGFEEAHSAPLSLLKLEGTEVIQTA